MSNYRRLISYIYAYEGGVKGKNIGYAKIEVRGDQCRIQVSVKKVYVGSSEIGVYLLSPGAEIPLGRIFIRNGAGEFRTQVKPEDVDGSGCGMDRCYGLTIHDVDSAWQSYTTIWEDAVAQAAEIQLAEVTAENMRKKEGREAPEETGQQNAQQDGALGEDELTELSVEELDPEEAAQRLPVSGEIERELQREQERLEAIAPWEESEVELEPEVDRESDQEPEVDREPDQGANREPNWEPNQEANRETNRELVAAMAAERTAVVEPEAAVEPVVAGVSSRDAAVAQDAASGRDAAVAQDTSRKPAAASDRNRETDRKLTVLTGNMPEPENPAKLEELDRLERENAARNNLWERLQRHYTKVLAFDYDNGCEILSIKPQDIGLLPREIWVFGNNSFLLHGYYNYRHLILARLNNPQGNPRYLLGVPGHYFSNEKYMASMFGFPHFVLAKKQPEEDGRFGYWYTDIRL